MSEKNLVFSLVGPHAHESLGEIFKRKIEDCQKLGFTFWLYRSSRCSLLRYQLHKPSEVWFITGYSKNSAKPTKIVDIGTKYFESGVWKEFDKNLSPVTGKITNNTTAFKLKNLRMIEEVVDFVQFVDLSTNRAVKFYQFCSTTIVSVKQFFEKPRNRLICAKADLENVVLVSH